MGSEASEPAVGEAVRAVLARVDERMSTWRDDSELAAVRRGPGPVRVSPETASVVEAALHLARETDGAFDPTVQPLMELWGLHGEPRTELPTVDEIAAVMTRVGHHRVQLASDSRGWTVDAGGAALDLSAIAKGHGVDAVSQHLSGLGLIEHYVEIGGEVRAHGRGPAGGAWRVGIDVPEEGSVPGRRFAAVVGLVNGALATSGNYRNAYEVDGQRVVHTMDPREGRPAVSDAASVSVVAPDCRTADGWATALMVLGTERGLAMVEARPELEALILQLDGPDFVQRASSGMSARLLGP